MKRQTKLVALLSALTAVLIIGILAINFSVNAQTNDNETSTVSVQAPASPDVATLFKLINIERTKVGSEPLTLSDNLNKSAQLKADDLFKTKAFTHVDSTGKHGFEYADEQEPRCTLASENLAQNTPATDSVGIVSSWVKSPAHYAAIINKDYKITGIAIQGVYIVEHFCTT